MLHSDPEAYGQLMLCISDKHEDSPAINAAILAQRRAQNDDGSFNILFPRYAVGNTLPTTHYANYIHIPTVVLRGMTSHHVYVTLLICVGLLSHYNCIVQPTILL